MIDEEALFRTLAEGRIGGAVLDTWYRYPAPGDPDPPPSRFPFAELPNVIMAPHASAWTHGMAERRSRMIAANFDYLARGEELENIARPART